ncbi:MAG: ATP-binding cassette domain-containing protein [Clostridia bacterium]
MQTNIKKNKGIEIILEVKDLTKYYKCDDVEDNIISIIGFLNRKEDLGIKGVTFDICKGRIIGLIGKKKCGKSTLLKLLSGVIKPSSGKILNKGLRMNNLQLREMVSYISKEQPSCQEYNCTLFENLIQYTCRDQEERSDVVAKAEKLITDFEIQDYKFKEVIKLPSAVRNKMFIIRGLLSHKEVLCFDQPLMFIEEKLQDVFKKYLDELVQAGKTIIISSEEENKIINMCNEIITL